MAAQLEEIFTDTRPAGADLSAASTYGKIVALNSSGQVILCSATTDKPFGVILQPAISSATGSPVVVGRLGRFKVQGDADLAKGNMIGTSADGQAAAYVFGTDTTKYIIGEVVDDNAAAGGYAMCDINCINPPRGA